MQALVVKSATRVDRRREPPSEDLLGAAVWLAEHFGFPSPSRAAHEARRKKRRDDEPR